MSRCYAYIVAYISRLEIGNVVLRPARLEVGHYDTACIGKAYKISMARLRAPACNFALRACMHINSYGTGYSLPVLVLVQLYMNRFVPVIGQA